MNKLLEEAFDEMILAEDFWKLSEQADSSARMAYHCQREAIERLLVLSGYKDLYPKYKMLVSSHL